MLRITDQYFWNFVFTIFFVVMVVLGTIILSTEARIAPSELTLLDLTLITLASWRLIRLFVYDTATKWLREQFLDATRTQNGVVLEKPRRGPRRTLADLFSCPWCVGLWAAGLIIFFYLLTPVAFYPVLLLAIGAVASYLQILANFTGHSAENQKLKSERGF